MATRSSLAQKPGDALRDQAAKLLASLHGPAKTEARAHGKKVDVYFEYRELGRKLRLYVEAKDYNRALGRADVKDIFSDHSGILDRNKPASLLIVTRNGLTTDADEFVNVEQSALRHQSILEIEISSVDLDSYLQYLIEDHSDIGLNNYYVESGFVLRNTNRATNDNSLQKFSFDEKESAYKALLNWVHDESDFRPVALLGGYGSGKTSVAKKIAAELALRCQKEISTRRPILLKLGNISRYSAIDGILGGLFTSEFPVRNFNLRNFQNLNENGHFLIILDGFDEMKHSMSWSDFRAQVQSLLQLYKARSKILLLGRPSAFLSEDEERHILRGERRLGDSWMRLPDWPVFQELELLEFTPSQRSEFVQRYLAHKTFENHDPAVASTRAEAANKIADADPELFAKPVHSKILTDLATDLSFDLSKFEGSQSRWLLYSEFIRSLYSRELEKEVRREISEKDRIEFLRSLAFWLWTERGTSISFSLSQLPKQQFERWEKKDQFDNTGIRREFLSGSILERKESDIYFFGHRSFAEFLVADQMRSNAPGSSDHSQYANALTDGVQLFLSEALSNYEIEDWASTFWMARGEVSFHYLQFLIDNVGGIEKFKTYVPDDSPWGKILKPFENDVTISTSNLRRILDHIWETDAVTFSWHFLRLVSQPAEVLGTAIDRADDDFDDFGKEIMFALLNSLFHKADRKDRYFSIKSDHVGLRRLAQRGILTTETTEGLEFSLDCNQLFSACVRELDNASLPWSGANEFINLRAIELADTVAQRIDNQLAGSFITFTKFGKSFSAITEVTKLKKPQVSSRRRGNPDQVSKTR